MKATNNIRDHLFIFFETGMQTIGEALSYGWKIWIFRKYRKYSWSWRFGNPHNTIKLGKPSKTKPKRELYGGVHRVCMFLSYRRHKDESYFYQDDGKECWNLLNYIHDVDNLFRKLRNKTGIQITAHMFRHTSLSILNSVDNRNCFVSEPVIKIYTRHFNTYVHPSDDEVSEAFRKVSDHLKTPGKEVYVRIMGVTALTYEDNPHCKEISSFTPETKTLIRITTDVWRGASLAFPKRRIFVNERGKTRITADFFILQQWES